jgi:hypothetical protein
MRGRTRTFVLKRWSIMMRLRLSANIWLARHFCVCTARAEAVVNNGVAAALRCAVLCYAMLCRAALCRAVLLCGA